MTKLAVRRLLFASLIVILTLVLRAQNGARIHALAKNDTSPTFSLTLSPGLRNKSVSEFRVGSKVWITITQKNLTNQPIDCTEINRGGVDSAYHYDVRDENGNVAEKVVKPQMELDSADIRPCNLAAGDSLVGEIQISRLYKLHRPGKYAVQVSRFDPTVKDEDGNPLKVTSNTITITITG